MKDTLNWKKEQDWHQQSFPAIHETKEQEAVDNEADDTENEECIADKVRILLTAEGLGGCSYQDDVHNYCQGGKAHTPGL